MVEGGYRERKEQQLTVLLEATGCAPHSIREWCRIPKHLLVVFFFFVFVSIQRNSTGCSPFHLYSFRSAEQRDNTYTTTTTILVISVNKFKEKRFSFFLTLGVFLWYFSSFWNIWKSKDQNRCAPGTSFNKVLCAPNAPYFKMKYYISLKSKKKKKERNGFFF